MSESNANDPAQGDECQRVDAALAHDDGTHPGAAGLEDDELSTVITVDGVETVVSIDEDDREELENDRATWKQAVSGISVDSFKDGTWLQYIVQKALHNYTTTVNAEYLQRKYPGLPKDVIVDTRIALASKYAALGGGASALATMAGQIVNLVGGTVAGLGLDVAWLTHLQVRLAWDISVLYGVEWDLDDPEEMLDFIKIAVGIDLAGKSQVAVVGGGPKVVAYAVKKIFKGQVLKSTKALPMIGKYLLQRNIVKVAVPVINVPVAAGLNMHSTRKIGRDAAATLRMRVRLAERARSLAASTDDHEALLWAVWTVIRPAPKKSVEDRQKVLLHRLTVEAAEAGLNVAARKRLRDTVDTDTVDVAGMIAPVDEEAKKAIYHAALVAVAVTGKPSRHGLAQLRTVADMCGVDFDEATVNREASRWT